MVALYQRENRNLVLKQIGYLSGVKIKSYSDYKSGVTSPLKTTATVIEPNVARTPVSVSKLVVENLQNRKRPHSSTDSPTVTKKMFNENKNW